MNRLLRTFEEFFKHESAGGILLFITATLAMIWANSPAAGLYDKIFDYHIGFNLGPLHLVEPLRLWINEGLMAIFFYVVGLEIKRELSSGELDSLKKAALPVAGALGGMVIPVLIFLVFNLSTDYVSGWAIPMATDIAFAMAIIRLFRSRVSKSVVVFLTALAIVDDLGAVIVIALFYSKGINLYALAIGLVLMITLFILNHRRVSSLYPYLFIGVLLWLAFFEAGVHPTIAGVILGLFTPGKHKQPGFDSPLHKAENNFLPWSTFLVIPVFGLANSGISVDLGMLRETLSHPLAVGIVLGLFLGKQLGIALTAFLAVKLRVAELSEGATWRQIYGAAIMGSIGFTMSIFIADLSLESGTDLSIAKLSIIIGSLISGIVGAFYFLVSPEVKPEEAVQE